MLKEILNNYSKRLRTQETNETYRDRERMDWEGGIQECKDKGIRRKSC